MSDLISPQNAARLAQLAQASCAMISRVVWSPDGARLALAHGAGIWLWDEGFGGAPPRTLEGHSAPVKDVAFSPDSKVIASASADTTVRLWVAENGTPLYVARGQTDAVNAVAFSQSGRLIASGGGNQNVLLLDMMDSTGSVALVGHEREITCLAFVGEVLASGGWDRSVRLWDIEARQERAVIALDDWVRDLAASPDGRTLAAACKDGTFRLIDVEAGVVTHSFAAHERGVDSAAFSPDGALLATSGRDNAIRLWDMRTLAAEPVMRLDGHAKPVLTVAFHPAGNLIASGSGDNTIRLWGIGAG